MKPFFRKRFGNVGPLVAEALDRTALSFAPSFEDDDEEDYENDLTGFGNSALRIARIETKFSGNSSTT